MKTRVIAALISCVSVTGVTATAPVVRESMAESALSLLDDSLSRREQFINRRQADINHLVDSVRRYGASYRLHLLIADRYQGFNNDSALHYYGLGLEANDAVNRLPFALGTARLLPLSGSFTRAQQIFDSIKIDSVPADDLALYYDTGRQMYSYMAAFSSGDEYSRSHYQKQALEYQDKLLGQLERTSVSYRFNLGEYCYLTGEYGKAQTLLEGVMDSGEASLTTTARAAHHLSAIARENGDNDAYTYYLAMSAIADLRAATREVASLQELGKHLYTRGDVNRSYSYLTHALASAVECGAPMRMIESSRSLPIIERAYAERLDSNRRTIFMIVGLLILLVLVLVAVMIVLNRKMHRLKVLQAHLREANSIKEVYISQFLNLCSIYMDKLNQFCKIANRKITAGKVDDLFRLTHSGKFVEEQSKEFYEVFDNAFLHLYPDFVRQVNALLQPDRQIYLKEGELLNTDLRILAFLRLGISESTRIAQVLNYSLNTIYAYRNRMKSRAIDRENFEDNIMRIGDNWDSLHRT